MERVCFGILNYKYICLVVSHQPFNLEEVATRCIVAHTVKNAGPKCCPCSKKKGDPCLAPSVLPSSCKFLGIDSKKKGRRRKEGIHTKEDVSEEGSEDLIVQERG